MPGWGANCAQLLDRRRARRAAAASPPAPHVRRARLSAARRSLGWVALHHGPGSGRLDHHHRDAVGDHVVDLPCQPRPLAERRGTGVVLALRVEQFRAGPGGVPARGAFTHHPPHEPRQQADDRVVPHQVRQHLVAGCDRRLGRQRDTDHQGQPRAPAVEVGPAAIEQQQHRQRGDRPGDAVRVARRRRAEDQQRHDPRR